MEATILEIQNALLKGLYTCEELVRHYIERIETLDKCGELPLNAVICINPHAVSAARRLDELRQAGGVALGALHGIPVLLKDNVETEDMPTTAGSLSLSGFETKRDADITKRLKEAGAIILAKTNLHEFAIWGETVSSRLGQSRNPYDRTRTPGGSSGGTGAALAANFGVVGIGTDTINSIRSPASACSLCGIRPTVGLVSDMGIVPYSLTQDTAGPLARTVEDAVRVLDVLVDRSMPGIPASYLSHLKADGLAGKRIGVLRGFFGREQINQDVNTVMEHCLAVMRKAGAELVEVNENIDSAQLVREVSVHLHELKTHLGEYLAGFGEAAPVHSISDILQSGLYTPGIEQNLMEANKLGVGVGDYAKRLEKRDALQKQVLAWMERDALDAFVYPHQQQLVCKVGGSQQQRNGVLGSVAGFPSIVVPGGFSPADENAPIGVPVGIEFLSRPYAEPTLIEAAYGFQETYRARLSPVL